MLKEFCKRGHRIADFAKPIQGGKYRACGKCRQERQRVNREQRKQAGVPETINRESRKKASRRYHLKINYGLTPQEFDFLLEKQKHTCALCLTPYPGPIGWVVDHNHLTGKVRGILCHFCNVGLGNFKDDLNLLDRAKDYIRKGSS